ncbi:MAG: GNAT family N-acetyltransferase [Betaproteobacteria bacterium]|nr:GNAT family N-acetyltransferase [Betaproteobacteria bacterium]NCV32230.1 GNAT family N-acetyltransferase [Betaproteobacteria bacterium]NCV55350.1 GNAT family N-acetyltransferase [Betaproteobacteria bacterium]NCW32763.1 GNAT family N-acetyltransferase [Betaproteobacteria bacterium]NCX24104.1 GNAT family N-acetyltransferase [Betaproteobacteria bacterium]
MTSRIIIVSVDPRRSDHAHDLLQLLDLYASGPSGRGYGLEDHAKARLCELLAEQAHYRGWLAYRDHEALGLVNAFLGISSFRAMPLLNIHDICVHPKAQRTGIGRALLDHVEKAAVSEACCKITLEVLEGNHAAVAAYVKAGFKPYQLDPQMGQARFFEKYICM